MRGGAAGIGGILLTVAAAVPAEETAGMPRIAGEGWVVARDPDLGPFTDPKQQPVDFGVWKADDGTWQLWSCIRATKCGGMTRLFHRWEGKRLTDPDWTPKGIAMQADPAFGETPGGLQAPFVTPLGGLYALFYGDWVNICVASSKDGKDFDLRWRNGDGKTGMFSEGPDANTRDPMVLQDGDDRWICYYTAHPGKKGAVYARTSASLSSDWSASKIVAAGGAAGDGPFSAECPFVVRLDPEGDYCLFRTQRYGEDAQTTVYRSKDPMDFGVNDDRCRVGTLPVAAPEILQEEGRWYIACLLASLKGIRIAPLEWTSADGIPVPSK